jgi:hypothetical protein
MEQFRSCSLAALPNCSAAWGCRCSVYCSLMVSNRLRGRH